MIKIFTIIFCVFTLLLYGCTSAEDNKLIELNSFIGLWNQTLDSSVTMEFTQDSLYYDSRYNKHSDDFKGGVMKFDGSIVEEDYGRLFYKVISKEENILIVSIYGENNGVEFKRKGYVFEEGNNTFIEIVYKMGKGLEDHIQYAVRYVKHGHELTTHSKPQDSLVLILPYNFDQEILYIAFDQKKQEKGVANIKKDRKVYISKDGINRISLKEDMNVLLDGCVSSYISDDKGQRVPLYTLQANEWKLLLKRSRNDGIDNTEYPIPLDSMVIFSSCRFNPSRKFVNKTFKQEITGNVLGFRYSTIKKELGYLGIE